MPERYSEGDIIDLIIKKKVTLSQSEEIFILESSTGDKFTLNNKTYKHYNLSTGKTIKAKIDRINCSGRIFIEPEHPIYKEGNTYNFELKKILSIKNKEADIIVIDCFNNEIQTKVHFQNISKIGDDIALKITFCRKGLPIVYDSTLEENFKYKERKVYPFKVIGLEEGLNEEKQYILADEEGLRQFLTAHYYEEFNFKTDLIIHCEVVRINAGRVLALEPLHPHYKIGEVIELQYKNPLSEKEAISHKHKLHNMSDKNGNIFLLSDRFLTKELKKTSNEYRIDAFKKGRIYVEPIN